MKPQPPDGAPLTQTQICRKYGISDETWRRWRAAQMTPDPVPNLPGAKRWRAADVAAFFDGRAPESPRRFFSSHRRLQKVG